MRPLWRAECCTPVVHQLYTSQLGYDQSKEHVRLNERKKSTTTEGYGWRKIPTEGRKQVKAKFTILVFPEASKMQLLLYWHVLDRVQGLFQSDLLITCVPQFTPPLKRNIFLNPKLIHEVRSWLSGNERKGRMRKSTETKPHNENYVSQANRAHVMSWLCKATQSSWEMAEAAGTAGARVEPVAIPVAVFRCQVMVRLDTSRTQIICCSWLESGWAHIASEGQECSCIP